MKSKSFTHRLIAMITVAATTALALTACSSADNAQNGPTDDGSNTIIVYSPQGGGERGEFVANAAKNEIGIEVKFVEGAGGEIADRLRAEKNNPQADVVMGLLQPAMYQLKKDKLFAPFTPEWTADLGPETKDADGQFHSFWQTPIVMAENTATNIATPTSWTDLADSKYSGKFALTNPGSQTTQAYLVGILWNYVDRNTGEVSDEGWDTLKKIYENSVAVPAGQNIDFTKVASGDTPIVLSYLGGIQTAAKENSIDFNYIDAAGGSPYVMESIALMSGTKHQAAAEKFIDWFGSSEFQTEYVQEIGNVIPLDKTALEAVPAETRQLLAGLRQQDIDWSLVADHLSEWMEKVQLDYVQ